MRHLLNAVILIAITAIVLPAATRAASSNSDSARTRDSVAAADPAVDEERCEIWIDLYSGEPVTYEDMFEDLLGAGVIYLGERHTLVRHHNLQEKIISDLIAAGVDVAVGLEMLPVDLQPVLEEFNSGEINFDELAAAADWAEIWDNYEQYRGAIEASRRAGGTVLGLNARRELAKEIARSGIDGLAEEWAAKVPEGVNTDQPAYERELLRVMMVMAHATGQTDMMRRMFEAQIIKDETMADAVARFLRSSEGKDHTVVVLCGAGHVTYGYGIPSRVRSRIPDIVDRIIVFSESGDVVLSEREKAMARMIEITHADLRENAVPFADYLHARALGPVPAEEAGAPVEMPGHEAQD